MQDGNFHFYFSLSEAMKWKWVGKRLCSRHNLLSPITIQLCKEDFVHFISFYLNGTHRINQCIDEQQEIILFFFIFVSFNYTKFHSILACLVSYANERVMQICHGKRSCIISADTATFGNPCRPESRMYLKIVYTCGKSIKLLYLIVANKLNEGKSIARVKNPVKSMAVGSFVSF